MVSVSIFNKSEFDKLRSFLIECPVAANLKHLTPSLKFEVTGLDPTENYQIFLSCAQVGDCKMKYINQKWKESYTMANKVEEQYVEHELKVAPGKMFMEKYIEFPSLRVTSNLDLASPTTIYLPTLRKFIPTIRIFKVKKIGIYGQHQIDEAPLKFSFPEAIFVTVTNYYNPEFCKLKTSMKLKAIPKRKWDHATISGNQAKRQDTVQKSSSANLATPLNIQANNPVRINSSGQNMQVPIGPNQFPTTNQLIPNPLNCSTLNVGPQVTSPLPIPLLNYTAPTFNPVPVFLPQNNLPFSLQPTIAYQALQVTAGSYLPIPITTTLIPTNFPYPVPPIAIPVPRPDLLPILVPTTRPLFPPGINMYNSL